ncbi:MAG TPA: hypothetical protein VM223_01125 [Planctomycetota bacterium]|nr:hypothetical protein [Planctomycetota bacterium]
MSAIWQALSYTVGLLVFGYFVAGVFFEVCRLLDNPKLERAWWRAVERVREMVHGLR